jgi:hypothetical protein
MNKLVIDKCFIKRTDNPWLPLDLGNEYIHVHVFKKCVIIVDNLSEYLPVFTEFNGYESSFIGSKCVKMLLQDENIIIKDTYSYE